MNAHIYTNDRSISAGTIARTAVLALALTNQVLSACGKPLLPIQSDQLEQLVTAGITTVTSLIAWWKNNSFTAAALEADKTFDRLKKSVHCPPYMTRAAVPVARSCGSSFYVEKKVGLIVGYSKRKTPKNLRF